MIILQLDKEKLERELGRRNLSANQLSKNLTIRRKPTKRTLDIWEGGGVVSTRWRCAICKMCRLPASELFDSAGHIRKLTLEAHHITREMLANVTVAEKISGACFTNWKSGGGIDPDNLFALASYLEIPPVRLLSEQTQKLLCSIMDAGSRFSENSFQIPPEIIVLIVALTVFGLIKFRVTPDALDLYTPIPLN